MSKPTKYIFRLVTAALTLVSLNGCQFNPLNSDSVTRQINANVVIKDHVIDGKRVQFNVYFVRDGSELSHNEWLQAMSSSDKKFSLSVMRGFAKVISEESLDKCGFGLTAYPNSAPFSWHIEGEQNRNCHQTIFAGQAYDADHRYKNIIHGTEHDDNRSNSTHSIAFNSSSMTTAIKRLFIPRGPYVTIFDFAKNANADEINDFFGLVKSEVERLFINESKNFFYEVHTGSNHAQAVPHFHLRAYEN